MNVRVYGWSAIYLHVYELYGKGSVYPMCMQVVMVAPTVSGCSLKNYIRITV